MQDTGVAYSIMSLSWNTLVESGSACLLSLQQIYSMSRGVNQSLRIIFLPQMQKNVEENYREERRSLLGCENPAERQKKIETEAQLAQASENVTSSLQRTRQMMTQVLSLC